MIDMLAPSPLVGDLLRSELAAASLVTDVLLVGDRVVFPGLDEAHRTQAASVVQSHASTAQAFLNQAAVERANEGTIRDRATAALATNTTFLDLASPTNAQLAAQVKALTRQNNGLIRLVLRRFDSTD